MANRVPFYTGAGNSGTPVHPAPLVRAVLNVSDAGGVTGFDHMTPRQQSTATDTIRLTTGGIVIEGAFSGQNNYTYFIDQDWTSPAFSGNSSGAARHDMVVVRVEDPHYEGSRDLDADDIIFQEIIEGVGASAETLADAGKPGYAAEPVARVEIPDGVTTPQIMDGDITDIRSLANARSHFFQDSVQHPDGSPEQLTLSNDTYTDFPSTGNVSVRVPPWATRMDVAVTIPTVAADSSQSGSRNIYGNVRALVDPAPNASGGFSEWNDEWPSGRTRFFIGHGATYGVVNLQGQTVTVQVQMLVQGGTTGAFLEANNGTSTIFQIYFRETPLFNP